MLFRFLNLLIFYSLAAQVVSDDPYNCAGTQTINPPVDTTKSWFYPANWNDTLPTPQFAGNQNCVWTINVPKGWFASWTVTSNTRSSVIKMTDSTGYVTTLTVASEDLYFLMDPSFKVELQASDVGQLGMQVTWTQVNPKLYPSTSKVHQNSLPLSLFGGDFDNSTVITADTQVSLLAFPSNILDFLPYLRVTQVYDGDSINAKHVGNLYQIMDSRTNFVSSGKSLTLFSLFPGLNTHNLVLLQDYSDVKQFKSYQPIYCVLPINCAASLNATQGNAAAIRYWPTFYITRIDMATDNKLSVYNGYLGDAHKLTDYTSANSKTDLPQKFNGKFTVFVLDKGTATIMFSGNPQSANWTAGFDGRNGFLASANYGLMSKEQSLTDQIFSSSLSDITYSFNSASLLGNATLTVLIKDGQKVSQDNTYTASGAKSGTVTSTGTSLTVMYETSGTVTSGPYVRFTFVKHNSAIGSGILLAVGISLWRMLAI
ncbi:hypothetical protein L5515_013339 [Caenorhabditis briggsae]|uniref:CUB-like domain-containing protein n=1 Tax=Caenorhabditis briggsae TaxID=6238 RepID=A0AAE9J6J0_CAEBR|nr:hypothetical protein L5515_013339 [Caenorhabditis briggsae]